MEDFNAAEADCINMLTLFVFLGPVCNWHWSGICVQRSLLLLRARAHTWDSETNSPAGTSIPLHIRSIGLIGWPKIDAITVTDEILRHGQTEAIPTLDILSAWSCWDVRSCLVLCDQNIKTCALGKLWEGLRYLFLSAHSFGCSVPMLFETR